MGQAWTTWAFFTPFRPSPEEALQWRDSLEKLLQNPCKFTSPCGHIPSSHVPPGAQQGLSPPWDHWCSARARPPPPDGLASFRSFLRSEFSEENVEFWVACEDYKKTKSPMKMAEKAKKIYEEFIQTEAPKEVSGHGAGDGTGRSQRRAMAAGHLGTQLRGSEGRTPRQGAAPSPRAARPPITAPVPLFGCSASAGLPPATGTSSTRLAPSPHRRLMLIMRNDNLE